MTETDKAFDINDYEAAIFDLDGVITQTATVHARAWKKMFDEFLAEYYQPDKNFRPFDIDYDYTNYVDGMPRYDGVRKFLLSRGIELPQGNPEDEPQKKTVCGLGNRKNRIFLELLEAEPPQIYGDAVKKLRQWKRAGIKTAIVSSSKNCGPIVKTAGLSELFDVRVDGITSVERNLEGKPAPDIFLEAARELNVAPAKGIVFEDAVSGVQAGRAGKFGLVIGIARKDNKQILLANGADLAIASFDELDKERK